MPLITLPQACCGEERDGTCLASCSVACRTQPLVSHHRYAKYGDVSVPIVDSHTTHTWSIGIQYIIAGGQLNKR